MRPFLALTLLLTTALVSGEVAAAGHRRASPTRRKASARARKTAPTDSAEPVSFRLQSSELSYKVIHQLHEVVGVCDQNEGVARLLADGTLQVMLRTKVACFNSQNANRDVHMLEVVEGQKFPTLEYKGVASNFKVPNGWTGVVHARLEGALTFHGVERPQPMDVDLQFSAPDVVSAKAEFAVSLESFKIERPALMFVKVDDKMQLHGQFSFSAERASTPLAQRALAQAQ